MVNVLDDQKVIIEIRLSSVPLEIAKVKKILPIGTATIKEDSLDGRDDQSWAEKGHPSPVVNDEGFMDLMANNNRRKTNVQECLHTRDEVSWQVKIRLPHSGATA